MGVQLGPFEDLLRAYGMGFNREFLKSSWYNSCFEIENAIILERQRCQKDFKVTERDSKWQKDKGVGMTHIPLLSISPGHQNWMKTYHNEANYS